MSSQQPGMGESGSQRVVRKVAELRELVGQEIGVGPWVEITQERVNQFADATGDHQYIHVDPERAKQTFFGGTIAHGYLTLSLIPFLSQGRDGVKIDLGGRMTVNYGLNRVRFPAPVRVGKRVRLRTTLLAVEEVGEQAVQITQRQTVEVEGEEKPACVAETLSRIYF
ncbi:MaoC family dehydratase [Sphaerobacter thermophilus]|uniref:MaoC domain protein dehydratase n=1 Tax=Sphaerobacter thermophilus (strain ATCC 49802 / DSM 20745 / KCCM 41009 / NCIMB 13125 / S 6022) TaxID=479434 RepID=D1C153_SPHTD|nr:MaoC family dehydratase [Sphaerobacter thermophilus]ACZ37970.1 MaoC domain protein dehydratase [Sphaerobacter thermophilus DSM 20745]